MPQKVIENPLFVGGPEGRDQIPLGTVAGEPVDYYPGRQFRQTQLQPLGVFLQGKTFKFPCQVVGFQIGTPQNVEQVEFDPVGACLHRIIWVTTSNPAFFSLATASKYTWFT